MQNAEKEKDVLHHSHHSHHSSPFRNLSVRGARDNEADDADKMQHYRYYANIMQWILDAKQSHDYELRLAIANYYVSWEYVTKIKTKQYDNDAFVRWILNRERRPKEMSHHSQSTPRADTTAFSTIAGEYDFTLRVHAIRTFVGCHPSATPTIWQNGLAFVFVCDFVQCSIPFQTAHKL